MGGTDVVTLGDFIDQESQDFEGSLSFTIKADYIKREKLWKSKDLAAEFLGNFWRHILDVESIKARLQFVCAELMENAVYHSVRSEYMIVIQLCFKTDELMVYVKNTAKTKDMEEFRKFAGTVLAEKNLQKLFIERMKEAKQTGSKKSQVGLITLVKDRGAKLSWKLEQHPDLTIVTTLARISLQGRVA